MWVPKSLINHNWVFVFHALVLGFHGASLNNDGVFPAQLLLRKIGRYSDIHLSMRLEVRKHRTFRRIGGVDINRNVRQGVAISTDRLYRVRDLLLAGTRPWKHRRLPAKPLFLDGARRRMQIRPTV